jgi:hypothetical protein
MKKTVVTFGLISGGISAGMLLATVPLADKIGFDRGELLGYTVIVLSALLIFFGVRSYRENASGGRLTFGRGFAVGILITLLSSVFYVATWEIVYFKFMPDFAEKYAAHEIERAKSSGASVNCRITLQRRDFAVDRGKWRFGVGFAKGGARSTSELDCSRASR